MAKGGKRAGAGRKKKPALPPIGTEPGWADSLIVKLNSQPAENEPEEIAGWRGLWDALAADIRLRARQFLYDHKHGKARHTVNHLHDKPIEIDVKVSHFEVIERARKRALVK